MQRIAFLLQIKTGRTEEYDEAHRHVWPELIRELESFGVTEYSIFRRGQQLFLFLRVPDFDRLKQQLAASEVNQRWQQYMAPLFEPVPGEIFDGFALLEEVFYMPGVTQGDLRA